MLLSEHFHLGLLMTFILFASHPQINWDHLSLFNSNFKLDVFCSLPTITGTFSSNIWKKVYPKCLGKVKPQSQFMLKYTFLSLFLPNTCITHNVKWFLKLKVMTNVKTNFNRFHEHCFCLSCSILNPLNHISNNINHCEINGSGQLGSASVVIQFQEHLFFTSGCIFVCMCVVCVYCEYSFEFTNFYMYIVLNVFFFLITKLKYLSMFEFVVQYNTLVFHMSHSVTHLMGGILLVGTLRISLIILVVHSYIEASALSEWNHGLLTFCARTLYWNDRMHVKALHTICE